MRLKEILKYTPLQFLQSGPIDNFLQYIKDQLELIPISWSPDATATTMKNFIIFLATVACVAAAPGYYLAHEPDYVHLPLSKSTYTTSSQTVDHGSTHVIHPLPVVHTAPLVHIPMSYSTQSHERTTYNAPASKTTAGLLYIPSGAEPLLDNSVAPSRTQLVTNSQPIENTNNMQGFVVFTALLACAAAAPGVLVAHTPVVAAVHTAPVVHAAVPVVAAKTTVTKSSQVVNHGTPLVAAPVVVKTAVPVVHATPVVHAAPIVHAPVVHAVHTPVVVKTAPAAITHSTSIVHHTPVVKAVPLVAVH
ncbi:unnamed protein product [Parnassius apollo]|uniref:(apollo) hypothetical protein n=2 Tax=Parnassius apollo TaxID=110799 RepID=A0A8S3WLB4_PARAO|nr:unnamed protein product [Parnassius apollo]